MRPWPSDQQATLSQTPSGRETEGRSNKHSLRVERRAFGDNGPTLYILGMSQMRLGQGEIEQAVALWERARTMRSHIGPHRIMLARYYESNGRHEDAQAIAREMLSARPEITAERGVRVPGALLERGVDPGGSRRAAAECLTAVKASRSGHQNRAQSPTIRTSSLR